MVTDPVTQGKAVPRMNTDLIRAQRLAVLAGGARRSAAKTGVSKDGSGLCARWFETRVRKRKDAAVRAPHHEAWGVTPT